MPLRYTPLGAALRPLASPGWFVPRQLHPYHQRAFHASSRALRDDHSAQSQNHYETLNIHPEATPAEIKKSFYSLSKRHHPDHNPHDPHAPRRCMRISEAYSILSHVDKRAHYDQHVLRRVRGVGHHLHSSHPAGGRPASGLSRRRSTFTGPPPSFFRSGGWGAHGAKRRAAHEESTGLGSGSGAAAGTGGAGGMGPGQRPFHYRRDDDMPLHWDRAAHERTHRRQEERRARRMATAREFIPFRADPNAVNNFLIVTGIVMAAMLGPFLLSRGSQSESDPKGKRSKD